MSGTAPPPVPNTLETTHRSIPEKYPNIFHFPATNDEHENGLKKTLCLERKIYISYPLETYRPQNFFLALIKQESQASL